MTHVRKVLLLLGGLSVAAGASGQPSCSPPGDTMVANTNALLSGKYICATRGSEGWQELHEVGGVLWDWKRGPSHALDQTKIVGTWVGSDTDGTVTYTYTGGTSYTWRVCRVIGPSAAAYNLRSATAGTILGATLVAGTSVQTNKPCPLVP